MRNLDVWYARLDVESLLAEIAKVADSKQMKAAQKNVAKAHKKNSLKAFDRLVREVDGEPRIISDPPLMVPVARAGLRRSAPGVRGADRRDARPLPREPQGRPPPPARQLPARRHGPQGGRGRQRRHPRLGAVDDGTRRSGPALPAGQGGGGLGARALRRGERVRQPRRAGGRGPVADAGRERHPPRLASGDRPRRHASGTSTFASSGTGSDRSRSRPCRPRVWRSTAGSAAGPWPAPTPDRATGSRSPPTSARGRASIRRSPTSPRPMPTRTSSTTQPSPTPPNPAASRSRRTWSKGKTGGRSGQACRPRAGVKTPGVGV